nr:putative replication associated protein [Crucivirus sp.]
MSWKKDAKIQDTKLAKGNTIALANFGEERRNGEVRTGKFFTTARRVCFTVFGHTLTDLIYFKDKLECRYLVCGKETCPKTGKVHIQGYVEFDNPIHFETCRNKLSNGGRLTPHIEKAIYDGEKNTKYCTKEGVYFIRGEMGKQGKRNDIEECYRMLKEGKSMFEIADDENRFGVWCKYRGGMREFKQLLIKKQEQSMKFEDYIPPCIIYITGGSGMGKTFSTYKIYWPFYVKMANDEWWDAYDDEPTVLIDDFRGEIDLSYMLQLLDKYPGRTGRIKGSSVPLSTIKTIIITSEKEPEEWYSSFDKEELKDGKRLNLRRRADLILNVNDCKNQAEVIGRLLEFKNDWKTHDEEVREYIKEKNKV